MRLYIIMRLRIPPAFSRRLLPRVTAARYSRLGRLDRLAWCEKSGFQIWTENIADERLATFREREVRFGIAERVFSCSSLCPFLLSLSLSLSLFLPPFLFFLEGGSGGERIQFNREIRGCATIAPLSLPLSLFLSLSLSLFLSLFLSLSLSLPDPHHSSAALPSVFRRFFRRHAIFAGDMNSACSELLIFRGLRLRLPYNRA